MGSAVVHLVGYPGAGKYTIAQHLSLVAAGEGNRYVVVDNHHTSNVIFTVLDVDGVRPVGREVWDRIGEVREVLHRVIEDLSPRDWSFVFTNVLNAGEPADEAMAPRLAALADARGAAYVPVLLSCERGELLRRVVSPERRARMKWIDPVAVAAFMDAHELVRLDGFHPLRLDVTALAPELAAHQILQHIHRLLGN